MVCKNGTKEGVCEYEKAEITRLIALLPIWDFECAMETKGVKAWVWW